MRRPRSLAAMRRRSLLLLLWLVSLAISAGGGYLASRPDGLNQSSAPAPTPTPDPVPPCITAQGRIDYYIDRLFDGWAAAEKVVNADEEYTDKAIASAELLKVATSVEVDVTRDTAPPKAVPRMELVRRGVKTMKDGAAQLAQGYFSESKSQIGRGLTSITEALTILERATREEEAAIKECQP